MNKKATSAPGMAVQALALEIVEALLADEKDGGYDLTAGLFGAEFSALVRRWAAAEFAALSAPPAVHAELMRFYAVDSVDALIAAQAEHIEKLQSKLPQAPSFAPQRVREG